MADQVTETDAGGASGAPPASVSGYHNSVTQRSIQAGLNPTVLIRAGGDVTLEGVEGDRVLAETPGRTGLKVSRRSETEFARLRAKVGETVLLDLRADLPKAWRKDSDPDAIEVQLGGDGRVQVPRGSSVRVYAGHGVALRDVSGRVSVYCGRDARLRGAGTLLHASCGRALDVECQALGGDQLKLEAGGDLRLYVRELADARIVVSDLGGDWQGQIGSGRVTLRLKAGGDVTLVTEREVVAQGPDFVIGRIEKPA